MNLRRTAKHGALAAVAVAGVAVFVMGPSSAQSGSGAPASEQADIFATSPSRTLPPGPNDVIVMGVWRNDKFHVVKLRTETAVIDTPQGTAGHTYTVSSREEIEAQLPLVDPSINPRIEPTPAQIEEMKSRVDAEGAKFRQPGLRPGPSGS
ncbi:hypothetical protein BH24ACT1_BH24ACT1_05320 [soil metagenome]